MTIDQAQLFGLARVALGAGAMLAPGPLLRMWGGAEADTPSTRMFGRALGGRDIALGLGAVLAARRGAPTRGWIEAGVLADIGDVAITLGSLRRLPRANALFVIGLAGGAAAYGRFLVSRSAS